MFKTFIDAFKQKDLRKKILITLGLCFLFVLGTWIPCPGIDLNAFKVSIEGQSFLSLLSSVSGGALANGAILALGVGPYISSSIIIQLLTIAFPRLQAISKQGEEGRKKIAKYTKWCALILAIAQAIGIVVAYSAHLQANLLFGMASNWLIGAFVVIILVAGSMFTYFLGEKITEQGIGNGMSLLIFIGILSTAVTSFYNAFANPTNGIIAAGNVDGLWSVLLFVVIMILIFGLIVLFDLAERKVPVQYAKQIKGRKMYGGQSSNIPIRLMGVGVMPIIFASSLLTFPQLIMSIFWPESAANRWYSQHLGTQSWLYFIVMGLLILAFAFFYAKITFNAEDTSKQIQANGGFIQGIRPGRPTADYLNKISNRITLFGAIFLAALTVIPSLIFRIDALQSTSLINAFASTGMIIVVSVALEVDKQVQAQMLMKSYKGFLK